MGRWCMTVELMGRVFVDTLGRQQNSIFSQLQSFDATEREIRREMDALRSSVHRDLQLDVRNIVLLILISNHVINWGFEVTHPHCTSINVLVFDNQGCGNRVTTSRHFTCSV